MSAHFRRREFVSDVLPQMFFAFFSYLVNYLCTFTRSCRYDSLELVGITRSYFGGLLCVGWSPDGNYVCVGGEDDLVTVWSFKERRVVARGQGHK